MSGEQWGEAVEREYVPTLAERIAEAIPGELTATPHVGIGGARRSKIARAVMPVVEAELARIVADTRRKVAEELRALTCCGPDDRCCCCDELNKAAAAIARGSGNGDSGQEGT